MSATYVAAPDPGPAEIVTDVLRSGRTASQVAARLVQGGQTCVEATLTVGTLDPAAEPWWADEPAVELPPRDECRRLPSEREGAPFIVPIMDRVDLRLDPAVLGFATGAPGGGGELRGWLAFADGRPIDTLALLFALDAFPPATFELTPPRAGSRCSSSPPTFAPGARTGSGPGSPAGPPRRERPGRRAVRGLGRTWPSRRHRHPARRDPGGRHRPAGLIVVRSTSTHRVHTPFATTRQGRRTVRAPARPGPASTAGGPQQSTTREVRQALRCRGGPRGPCIPDACRFARPPLRPPLLVPTR